MYRRLPGTADGAATVEAAGQRRSEQRFWPPSPPGSPAAPQPRPPSGNLAGGSALPAAACGGLVAPNGTVRLLRTTTLAAWHDGVEHYITSFQFAGDSTVGEFGSIVPLPAVPTSVERGGDWTLQRLEKETTPPRGIE